MDENGIEDAEDEGELEDGTPFSWRSLPLLHFIVVAYYAGPPVAVCFALYWIDWIRVYWPICLVAALAWPLGNLVVAAIQGID